ncbi:hypothetical protein ACFPM7_25940 [Actinokineospora guangxiensis]|uniref:PE family protein n=1 Tax=Actinokineospora guangxiensis TaxID=1490288 RepID=A0ABW0EWF1_9PSEU
MTEMPAFAEAAGAVGDVRSAVEAGDVVIEAESAEALIAAIDEARLRVDGLRAVADTELASPLAFGDNWVGRIVSARISTAAAGHEESAGTVLAQFAGVLDQLAVTVREAVDSTVDADDDAAARLYREV